MVGGASTSLRSADWLEPSGIVLTFEIGLALADGGIRTSSFRTRRLRLRSSRLSSRPGRLIRSSHASHSQMTTRTCLRHTSHLHRLQQLQTKTILQKTSGRLRKSVWDLKLHANFRKAYFNDRHLSTFCLGLNNRQNVLIRNTTELYWELLWRLEAAAFLDFMGAFNISC